MKIHPMTSKEVEQTRAAIGIMPINSARVLRKALDYYGRNAKIDRPEYEEAVVYLHNLLSAATGDPTRLSSC